MRFERRRIIIRSVNSKDIVEFCYQEDEFRELTNEEKENKVDSIKKLIKRVPNNISSQLVLAVEEKDTGKLIGIIDVQKEKEPNMVSVTALIPNEQKLMKYGYDVIDQFRKICRENWHDIKKIKLNRRCRATSNYIKQSGNDSEIITIAQ